jgi:hypothetical protein
MAGASAATGKEIVGGPRTNGTGPALEWTGGLCSPQDSDRVQLK